ncbi:Uu.00g090920.m01.CDS01 [Anthostomella pinea]|uniref:Uu.00g090920.m01.CDS01 n=1 Tax=Anthostomella pinea TaxID=933095 RepID=A0AAI8YK74_9PEZI|nr:Uu.00g090920.m01.CDS01 [Anthostomella pinea]
MARARSQVSRGDPIGHGIFNCECASLDDDGFGSLDQWAADEPACDKMSGRFPSGVGRRDDIFMITNPDLVPFRDAARGIKPLHPGDVQPSVDSPSSNYHRPIDVVHTAGVACLSHDVQPDSTLIVRCPSMHENTPATDLPGSLPPKDNKGITSHHATDFHTPESSNIAASEASSTATVGSKEGGSADVLPDSKKRRLKHAKRASTSILRARKNALCFGDEEDEYKWNRGGKVWKQLEDQEHVRTAKEFLGENPNPLACPMYSLSLPPRACSGALALHIDESPTALGVCPASKSSNSPALGIGAVFSTI